MKLSAEVIRSPRITRSRSRRGVLMLWSVFVILAAGLIAGALFNVIWLSGIRNQARHCSESAALAAGQSYLSDDLLRPWQQPFEHEGRAARCQNTAIRMVEEYRRRTSLPPISSEHVQLDWPQGATFLNDPSQMVPTRIRVSFDSSRQSYQVPLFFAGLTGLESAKLGVWSAVEIEHAPTAFRPGPNNSVPMLPFAIFDQGPTPAGTAGSSGPRHWSDNIESGQGKDNYSWNSSNHQFELGPDGLPEVTVTISPGSASPGSAVNGPDAFVPLSFCAVRGGQVSSRIPEWIGSGLSFADLQTLGLQEVSFPGSLPTLSLTSQQLSSVSNALVSKRGEPCIVCLCSASQLSATGQSAAKEQSQSGSKTGLSSISLERPVAARIVEVISGTGGTIKVTLQPCVLTTSTSITASDSRVAANRYVYSVRLCN